jgi:hypothetical protein
MPGLLIPQQIATASHIEVVTSQLESCAKAIERL